MAQRQRSPVILDIAEDSAGQQPIATEAMHMAEAEKQARIANITVEEFAEVTFKSVLRALESRQGKRFPIGPIIYGIIAWPEGFPGEIVNPTGPPRA